MKKRNTTSGSVIITIFSRQNNFQGHFFVFIFTLFLMTCLLADIRHHIIYRVCQKRLTSCVNNKNFVGWSYLISFVYMSRFLWHSLYKTDSYIVWDYHLILAILAWNEWYSDASFPPVDIYIFYRTRNSSTSSLVLKCLTNLSYLCKNLDVRFYQILHRILFAYLFVS